MKWGDGGLRAFYGLFHLVLRALVAATAGLMVLASVPSPVYRWLVHLGLDAYIGIWGLVLSPVSLAALLGIEYWVMRKDFRERKALAIDLVVCAAWVAATVILFIYGVAHIGFL